MTHVKIIHSQGYPQNLGETNLMRSLSRKRLDFFNQSHGLQPHE